MVNIYLYVVHLLVWIINLSFALRRVRVSRKKRLLSSVLSLRPSLGLSVRRYRFGSHWTDLCQIWCGRLLRKSVEKIPGFFENGTEMPGTLQEDLSTYILLKAVRNVWLSHNSGTATFSWQQSTLVYWQRLMQHNSTVSVRWQQRLR
jgi:hypothetical protein